MLMRAVEAAGDALYRREKDAEEKSAGEKGGEDSPKPKQRRADAVGLVAERVLAAGFGEEASEEGAPGESGTRAERLPGHHPCRRGDADGRRRARPLGSGRDSRFRGNVPAHGVRRGHGHDVSRRGRVRREQVDAERVGAQRRSQDAHDSTALYVFREVA